MDVAINKMKTVRVFHDNDKQGFFNPLITIAGQNFASLYQVNTKLKTYYSKEMKKQRENPQDKKILIKIKTMIYRNPEEFQALGVTKKNSVITDLMKSNTNGLVRKISLDDYKRLKLEILKLTKLFDKEQDLGTLNLLEMLDTFQNNSMLTT